MKNTKIIIWIVAAVAVVGLGALILSPQAGIENVDAARMQELVTEGVRVVDVRTSGEYETGHIPGSENVPMSVFEAESAGWDKDEPIGIYCTTGDRSATVVQFMEEQGFTEVYHFAAGLIAWGGELEGGQVIADMPAPEPTGTPVLYEFYTDW